MQFKDGWLDKARKVPSPNFNPRPVLQTINMLVIHNISLPPDQFGTPYIEQFFSNCLPYDDHPYFETLKGVEVSAHFLIKRNGDLVQFVSCEDRAWHAGISSFCGETNCNDFSIGIELEGNDVLPYTDKQYATLIALTNVIQEAYPAIARERIVGHCTIAPDRKTDPGESFDWDYYLHALNAD